MNSNIKKIREKIINLKVGVDSRGRTTLRKLDVLDVLDKFENMRDMAELRVLSNHSLENPLTDRQHKRVTQLKKKLFRK